MRLMEKITFAQKVVKNRIKGKQEETTFQDYSDYGDYCDYGDSNSDWT